MTGAIVMAPDPDSPRVPTTPRAFLCRCGRRVFFRNSVCLACGTALGYDPELTELLPLEKLGEDGEWASSGPASSGRRYLRCANLETAAACNWLIADDDPIGLQCGQCRSCRLTRTLPDLSIDENGRWWGRIELAKRRLVSSLIGLGLPVCSRTLDDPQSGLAIDLLRAARGAAPIVTGPTGGVITIDVEEADDSTRERRRADLREPYRTVLGHLRHESGHYYWERLVEPGDWLEPWRTLFGDERLDYRGALEQHYRCGPPARWQTQHVSAYASCHPWEDWAETWAHYLHVIDTLDTARSFGLEGDRIEADRDGFTVQDLDGSGDDHPESFLALLNPWIELTAVINELSRGMGAPDFYPFVLSAAAVRKLHFVHRVIGACREGRG